MSQEELKQALRNSTLHPLLIIIQKALTRSGLGDVEIMDRRTNRQHSRYGGFELQCKFPVGDHQGLAVVKVVRDSVHQRMISELAGTVLLRQATMGILVATRGASKRMRDYLAMFPMHLEIVDGDRLAELCQMYGIGVRPHGELDYEYFQYLEENSPHLIDMLKKLSK